ncbi:MAG TPA: hypothetical protein VGR28_00135 [Candidatus Thermoplasmatota archaeon]|jgi:hypothetical protein|nr:hypothetical protein [Candidatus Thermoplasmatota archaeon]
MRVAVLLLAVSALFAGCINQAQPQPLPTDAPAATPVAAPEPVTATWNGRVLLSPLGMLAHNRDTEPLVAPIQAEGFVFEITEVPQSMMVELHWPGPGTALIMVSTPHVEGKGFEYFTEMSSEAHQCLMIPPAELEPGLWQVMVHTDGSALAAFDFDVTTVGGVAAILQGEPHSSAEAAETQERDELPCPEMEHSHA